MNNQSNPAETTSSPGTQGRDSIEILVTRHKILPSTPIAPQLPEFSNDGRSTPWKLEAFAVQGPYVVCTWRRYTSLPLLLEAAIEGPSNLPKLAPALQLGRPQLVEDQAADAPADTSLASDLALLSGRMIPLAVAPSAAPPAPPAAPLPHWARERSPMPTARNVALYTGGQQLDAGIPFDVAVRPSSVDPSLLVSVPGVAPEAPPAHVPEPAAVAVVPPGAFFNPAPAAATAPAGAE